MSVNDRVVGCITSLRGKRIVVTGATGFIGRALVHRLRSSGIDVTAVGNGMQSNDGEDQSVLSCDITQIESVEALVENLDPEIVFHCAGLRGAERTYEFAVESVGVNFMGTHNLLTTLGRMARNLRRVVIIGSSEEYGNADVVPITEDQPVAPVSPYSAAKAAATQFALLYNKLFDLPVVVFRPFIVYGPGQSPTMFIPELIRSATSGDDFAMTNGEQTRDFVYIDDVVDCLLLGAVEDSAVGEVFNICSQHEHTMVDIAQRVLELSASDTKLLIGAIEYRANEAWRLVGSNKKAKRIMGWSPSTDLDDGLRATIEWFRMQEVEQ